MRLRVLACLPRVAAPSGGLELAGSRLDLDMLVAALHWYTGVVPIHPRRSVIYFDATRTDDGVPRVYGESQKEYATENRDPRIVLRDCDAAPLASMIVFARRTRNTWTSASYQHASLRIRSSTPRSSAPAPAVSRRWQRSSELA